MNIRQLLSHLIIFVCFFASFPAFAQESAAPVKPLAGNTADSKSDEVRGLIKEAEDVKQQMIQLNRELYHFEEKLLYPTETQLSVFLSLQTNSAFSLDSIELELDDKVISSHLYQPSEIEALKKGGIQRIYLGSLADGKHKLTAQFNGKGINNNYYRRKKALKFTKENIAKYIQLEIGINASTKEPVFKVKQW